MTQENKKLLLQIRLKAMLIAATVGIGIVLFLISIAYFFTE